MLWPQHPGGGSWEAGISKGIGDLDKDGWNIQGTFGFQHQDQLEAAQRSVSQQGAYLPFSWNGVNYIFNQRTSNTSPANLTFQGEPRAGGADPTPMRLNPYYVKNGNCGTPFAGVITDPAALEAVRVQSCRFNYASTVQDIPSDTTAELPGEGLLQDQRRHDRVGDGRSVAIRYEVAVRASAQPFGINNTTRLPSLYANYVQPFLTANGPGQRVVEQCRDHRLSLGVAGRPHRRLRDRLAAICGRCRRQGLGLGLQRQDYHWQSAL